MNYYTLPLQLTFPVRILRVLVAIGFCGEADLESYIATPLTMAMTALPLEAAVKNTSRISF